MSELRQLRDGGGDEVRIDWAEMLSLPVPTGLPSSPSTAIVSLPAEFAVWQAQVAAVAQDAGLDLLDYSLVTAEPQVRPDGGTDVVFLFGWVPGPSKFQGPALDGAGWSDKSAKDPS